MAQVLLILLPPFFFNWSPNQYILLACHGLNFGRQVEQLILLSWGTAILQTLHIYTNHERVSRTGITCQLHVMANLIESIYTLTKSLDSWLCLGSSPAFSKGDLRRGKAKGNALGKLELYTSHRCKHVKYICRHTRE